MVLMQKLWSLNLKECRDMSAYLNSFKELSTQVANLSPNRLGVPDNDLVLMISLSLLQCYEPLIMAVQSWIENITLDFLCGRLLQEATGQQAARSTTTKQESEPGSTFTAGLGLCRLRFHGRKNGREGNRGFEQVIRVGSLGAGRGWEGMVSSCCYYCNKEGYWKNDCLKRQADLQRDYSEGHLAFMGVLGTGKGGTNWIINSGAARHLFARQDLFKNYINIVSSLSTIGDGKEITHRLYNISGTWLVDLRYHQRTNQRVKFVLFSHKGNNVGNNLWGKEERRKRPWIESAEMHVARSPR